MKKIYALLIIMTILMTACQPTPEKEVIKSKNKDLVQEVIDANEEENIAVLEEDKEIIEQQIEAINRHLNMEFQANDRVRIVVDADVLIPTYDKIPMVRVQPENLTGEHLEILLRETVGENPVYFQNYDLGMWSTEEIQQIMINLKGYLQNKNLKAHIVSQIQSSIDFLEEMYPSAISREDEKLFDGLLVPTEGDRTYSYVTRLKSYLGKAQAAKIQLLQSFNKMETHLVFSNEVNELAYNTFEKYEGIDAEKINLPYTKCKEMAEQIVKTLDGDDTNMDMYSSEIGYSIGFYADYTKETSPQCYTFKFARNYNGVLAKNINGLHGTSEMNYSESIKAEKIIISIDNDGIYSVSWDNYSRLAETLAQDVPLMDFDSVNNIFTDYCEYKFSWVPQYENIPENTPVTINVDSVELNLMMMLEKDKQDSYIMIPVWDYIGDISYDQKLTAQDGYPIKGEKNVAILTINAIDGTIIDRGQGY